MHVCGETRGVAAVLSVEDDRLGLALRLARDGDAVDLAGREEEGVVGRGHGGDGVLGLLDLDLERVGVAEKRRERELQLMSTGF